MDQKQSGISATFYYYIIY